MNESKIIGYETRHVVYCKDKPARNDMLFVNEYTHYDDGRREKTMRMVENFERPLWVVKPGQRTFTDKRQWIDESKLNKYHTTQCNLYKKVNSLLNTRYRSNKDAFSDPYLFGCAASSQSELKRRYVAKWEKCISPQSSVAVLDTETSMVDGSIILITLTCKDRIFCGVVRSFLKNTSDDIARQGAERACEKYLGDILRERGATPSFHFYDTEGDAVLGCIKRAHEWQPDFVVFWNMLFDMDKMVNALKNSGYDLAQVFSDPRVPDRYKFFSWVPGPEVKLLHNGDEKGLAPYERWHIANAPATFFFACAMTTYYRLRMALGKLPGGYGLDATLKRHLNLGKLSFDKADHKKGAEWHTYMQENHPYEYIAYNIFDCIGVELLDEKNRDFSLKFNTRCTVADYTEFKSGPRIIEVKMTNIVPKYGKRLGVCGRNHRNDLDAMVVGPRGWTMTLPSFIIEDSKVNIIKDWKNVNSLVFLNVSDLDITSTYPAVQVALNVSKETTVREVVSVEGLEENDKRRMFVDMVGGISSAVEVCNLGFGLPVLDELLDIYKKDKA